MSSSLTPIKVRGKKKTKSKHPVHSLLNPDAKGKRPLSAASALPAPAKRSRQVMNDLKPKLATSKNASFLENLPTELLENIFFNCLNVGLPQASPLIGQKLASHHVKSQLTYKVLSSASSTEYPCALAAFFPTLQEQADAQSAILRLKWMTLPFLKDLIPDFIVRTLVRQLGVRKLRWMGSGPVVSSACEPLIRQYLEDNKYRLEEEEEDRGLPAYWELNWSRTRSGPLSDITSEYHIYHISSSVFNVGIGLRDGLVRLGLPSLDAKVNSLELFSRWRIFGGIEGCKIPEKLLHGPWTNEKCEFLELAIRGNATVDWVRSTSGEIAKEGLLQAMEDGNSRAVKALLLRVFPTDSFQTPYYATREARAEGACKLSMYQDVPIRRGVGIHPTNEHLRKAITTASCSGEILSIILRATEQSDETYDDTLFTRAKQLSGAHPTKWKLHDFA